MTQPIVLTSDQANLLKISTGSSIFLEGPARCGKTTASVLHLRHLIENGIPGDEIVLFIPQRNLAAPYTALIEQPAIARRGIVTVITLDGLAQRLIDLFWPLISDKAGFGSPDQFPTYLTLETAQYHLAHLVRPLLAEGYFDSVSLPPNRIYSQILDNLNKSALVGFPYTEIGDRLTRAYTGKPAQLSVYKDVQTCASLFREFCYKNNLLDFSMQIELFTHYLWADPFIKEYVYQQYHHMIVDNLEEDTPVAHDFFLDLFPKMNSALFIFDWDAGFRNFLGADPHSAYRIKAFCEHQLVWADLKLIPSALSRFATNIVKRIKPESELQTPVGNSMHYQIDARPGQQNLESEKDRIENHLFYEVKHYFPEMLDWVVEQVDALVNQEGVSPEEIVVLAPYLPDALKFLLQNRMEARQLQSRSHRPSRPLREEPATRCLLTLSALAFPEWEVQPARLDVAYALVQAIDGMDFSRAKLLTDIVYRNKDGIYSLFPFESIKTDSQVRITYTLGERYDKLRSWLLENARLSVEYDVFLSRFFGEILSQPGFGFHTQLDAGIITANLIESVQKFRWAVGSSLAESGMVGREYIKTIHEGLVAAQYLSRWTPTTNGILLAPAYSYLLSNQPVDYQFWINIGSRGWYERLEQPLTHPYVLSRNWPIGQTWNDVDEIEANRRQLAKLVQGLIRRCKKGIYLGICELDEQGYEEAGLLIRSIQDELVKQRGIN
jgi:hypothetical protein